MRNLTRKCLAAGLVTVGVGANAHAQESAPAGRIGRVVAAPVARAAAPDDRPPQQAVPGWLSGPTSTAVRPLTGAEQAAASVAPVKKPGLAESTFSGVKSFIAPPAGPPATATPTPLPQGMRPPAAQYAASPTPGVYAGPPAYRWYGYGAVTPGRNPHAPDGVSPRGSPNWYVQSGATPGAFPVTVTASGQPATTTPVAPQELPSYTLGNVAGSFDRGPALTPAPAPTSAPDPSQPLPATVTASVEAASLSTPSPEPTVTPLPVMTFLPTPPAPEPTPTLMPTVTPPTLMPTVTPPTRLSEPPAFAPTAAAEPPTPAPAGPQPLLTWNSSSTDPAVAFTGAKSPAPAAVSVAAVSPMPSAGVTPVSATVTPVSPAIVPASFTPPAAAAPAVATPTGGAAKPVGRSQGPGDAGAPTLERSVRDAAYGFATVVEVKHTGPSAVTVRLQAASAADARSAAELVSKLPALKPYAVEFLVTLTK